MTESNPNPTLYWYAGCSTCKKAARLLDANGVAHARVDLKSSPPDVATLRGLWARSGAPIKRLFNTSGQSYRGGGFSTRLPDMTDDDALAALAADGMLIKRPLLASGERVLIGFSEAEWQAAIA